MQLIDSGSQIKVLPPASGTKYICGIDMCNTMVFDTVEVVAWPLSSGELLVVSGEISVYPNPANDVVNIRHAVGDVVSVYNAVGQLVLTQEIKNNQAVVNVSYLAKGVYVVKTITQVGRFVKE